jgi:hypothetical protein
MATYYCLLCGEVIIGDGTEIEKHYEQEGYDAYCSFEEYLQKFVKISTNNQNK